jgi:hypothetical protein
MKGINRRQIGSQILTENIPSTENIFSVGDASIPVKLMFHEKLSYSVMSLKRA